MNNPPDATQLALLNAAAAKLAADPKNEELRTSILKGQVQLTAKQLGITTVQSADAVRSYTSAYIYSKGQDPKEVLDALNSAQQQILNYDKNKPKLYGMDLVTANKFASYFAIAAGPVLFLAIIAFCVALFMIGPEAAAAVAAAGGVVEALTAVTGVAVGSSGGVALALGGFLFLISQALGHFANYIPMTTKQMVDNGSIAPGLQITAIKNVAEVTSKLSGTKTPGSYTAAQFDALVFGLQAAGITQIKNPVSGDVAPFSRQSLAGLINYVYGSQVAAGAATSPSKLTPLLQPWLLKGAIANSIPLSLYDQVAGIKVSSPPATPFAPAAPAAPVSHASSVSVPKVFTGVVSQGMLGNSTSFVPRPDDLITSVADLETAAANNLVPFIASLPSRIIYEVKIVSSITTGSGFTQRGTTQRVQSGTNANGSPKYKTVTNRFAVLNLYILGKTGTRSALGQIVLGPTDALQFQPVDSDIAAVQDFLGSSIHTTDLGQINSLAGAPVAHNAVSGAVPALVDTTTGQTIPVLSHVTSLAGVFVDRDRHYDVLYKIVGDTLWVLSPYQLIFTDAEKQTLAPDGNKFARIPDRLAQYGIDVTQIGTVPYIADISSQYRSKTYSPTWDQFFSTDSGTPQGAGSTAAPAACAAQTLYDFYTAQGKTLPSIADRQSLYQSLGLGTASLYVGTAEQNTKLLFALQKQAGCSVQ